MGWHVLALLAVTVEVYASSPKVPTFAARQDYGGGGAVQVVDINGDGIPDITEVGVRILTLIGNGDGTFSEGPTTVTEPGFTISSSVSLDLNGDGFADVVLSPWSTNGPGLGICFGNGDGTFQAPVVYPGGGSAEGIVAGDFNGDGLIDIAYIAQGVWLFTGKGGGLFNPGVYTPMNNISGRLVAADFNGDGKLDLAAGITANDPGGFAIIFGNGDGTFQQPVYYMGQHPPSFGHFISDADLNGDGHPDIVVTPETSSNTYYTWLNRGDGSFYEYSQIAIAGYPPFSLGDINRDGYPDFVNSSGFVALGIGDGSFAPPINYPVQTSGPGGEVFGPAIADLTHNGDMDVVVGNLNTTSVLLNNHKGGLKDGVWMSVPGSGNCAAGADYNGDGRPDLAVPTTAGIAILLGTGEASKPYTVGVTIPVSGLGCPVAGDLNNDGIPDLLVGSSQTGGVVAYLGNGDGTFRLAGTTSVAPGVLVLGDFNHDGNLDFADSSNQLAYGNGDGTFQSPQSIVAHMPYGGFSWIVAAEVNHDGWTDLLLTNWNDERSLYVLLNNHKGGWIQTTIENDEGPLTLAVADLNGDGNLDAVVETFYGYDALAYLGDGKGNFTLSGTIPYIADGDSPPAIGDINGDGIPDLLMPSDGSLQIELGNGDGTFTGMVSQGLGPSPGQILLENLHGQPPKNHLPDIVSPDSSGGVTVLINTTK